MERNTIKKIVRNNTMFQKHECDLYAVGFALVVFLLAMTI